VKISYNWIKELVDLSSVPDPQALADLLTERGLEVEEIARQDQGLEWVISAEILEKGKHPDSDRLSLCKIKTGKKIAGADEVLEVVCGATNHKTGDKIVLAQVGANLPNGMKIGKGKIRGVESFGMLCSESELGLAKESQGIIILPAHTQVGKPIAEVLGKNDTIFTLKLYANQGHFLSHYGVARELAAALSLRPGLDQVLKSLKKPSSTVKLDWKNSPIAVELKAGDLAPQFLGVLIEGVKVGPSPASVVTRLQACGLRSINNVVDATNILLMELGHPVHAYDADKISGKKIGVRLSGKDEKLPLLDGTTLTLDGSELVIFDGAQAIGLAGVMGGGNSEVTEKTTRVFLECAQFDPVTVRKAKARHQKQTDAAHRFERGVDPQGLGNVISRLATLVIELAGGKTAGSVKAQIKAPAEPVAIEFPYNYVSDFLGLETSASEIEKIFTSLECKFEKVASKDVSSKDGGHWKVTPPSYRLDLKIRQDLAEEVARSVGYDKIPNQIPPLSSAPTPKAFSPAGGESVVMDRAKDVLVKQGLCETINYAFTSQAWLNTFGMKAQAKVINPLSEEHEFLVPSLLPGLVQNAVNNFRHHFGSEKLSVRLFEVRPTFSFEGIG